MSLHALASKLKRVLAILGPGRLIRNHGILSDFGHRRGQYSSQAKGSSNGSDEP